LLEVIGNQWQHVAFESGMAQHAKCRQVIDFIGSGGGTRTPDTRIMIPLL